MSRDLLTWQEEFMPVTSFIALFIRVVTEGDFVAVSTSKSLLSIKLIYTIIEHHIGVRIRLSARN